MLETILKDKSLFKKQVFENKPQFSTAPYGKHKVTETKQEQLIWTYISSFIPRL